MQTDQATGWTTGKIGDHFWTKVKILAWFQASAAMQMRSALFRDLTRRRLVILYRRFGTTCRSKLQGSSSPRRRWDWKVLVKCRSRIIDLCCVRSQNSADLVKNVLFATVSRQTLRSKQVWKFYELSIYEDLYQPTISFCKCALQVKTP
jgi:hypothetical protein